MKRLLRVLLVLGCLIVPVLEPKASSIVIEAQQSRVVNLLYDVRINGEGVPDGSLYSLYTEDGELVDVLKSYNSRLRYRNLSFGNYYIEYVLGGKVIREDIKADLDYLDTQNTYKVLDFKGLKSETGTDEIVSNVVKSVETDEIVSNVVKSVETGDSSNVTVVLITSIISGMGIVYVRKKRKRGCIS